MGRWLKAQLVGEALGATFERGISQHPNVGDAVHLVVESDLVRIYGTPNRGQVILGRLASAENIAVHIDLDRMVTRHAAVIGSTGAGKSTAVAGLVRSLALMENDGGCFPSARLLMLDIHGEYGRSLSDVAAIFKTDADETRGEAPLRIPYWALDASDLVDFLFGPLSDGQRSAIGDKITSLKLASWQREGYAGVQEQAITVDAPVPFSLHRLWYDFIEPEVRTYLDREKENPALEQEGDPETLTPPRYRPATTLNTAPFINPSALGIKQQLMQLRSRLLDHRFDFLLHPGGLEPTLDGQTTLDVDHLLRSWLGHEKPVTVLDLSGVPSDVLGILIGSVLKIVYEAMFWARGQPGGTRTRPLLIIMEEAHRYLEASASGPASAVVRKIVKEGRKYGIGAVIVSQRPSEIDETILSQCGTFFALRLSNATDRARVQAALPDSLAGVVELLPVLRTGEAVILGEAARLPARCRMSLPSEDRRPDSEDPKVAQSWSRPRTREDYRLVAACWRAKDPYYEMVDTQDEEV